MSDDALTLLRSIDATMKQILIVLRASAPPPIASDSDLDGKYGNPILKFIPRDWTGDHAYKGHRFSECPSALLQLVASTFDYFATEAEKKDERTDKGKPIADYKRADAARARGWAKRNKGRQQPAPVAIATGPSDGGWNDDTGGGWQPEEDGF